jgi:predicted TIM-barrel fold metal-dependent hydrolase
VLAASARIREREVDAVQFELDGGNVPASTALRLLTPEFSKSNIRSVTLVAGAAMDTSRVVISMDSHTELVVDLRPYLPKKYHETFEEGVRLSEHYTEQEGNAFRWMLESHDNPIVDFPIHEDRGRGISEFTPVISMKQRLEVLDDQGVAGEFITPFTGAQSADPDVLHAYTDAYHRYFDEYVSPAPFRFRGASVVNLVCGIETVLNEVADADDHGLCAVELSGNMEWVSPDLPKLNSPYYDPLWAALNERGMGVVFHGGTGRAKPLLTWEPGDPGWELLRMIDLIRGHRDALTYLMVAGVAERFPNIRFGYLESGTRWIPPLLKELDGHAKSLRLAGWYPWERLPSEQWSASWFAGGALDVPSVHERHQLGVPTMVWGSDYPHVEGTFPHTGENLAELFADVPEVETEAVVAGNAVRLFGFDYDALAQTAAAKIPWPDRACSSPHEIVIDQSKGAK